ncbi:unnamed protein product [Urochloa decumbens]|uniref:Uncharacterized protein n=1 Tax=Urochloa decumbens TaxID=240449 RepID=A0ABC9EYC3_9POAL
MIDISPIQFVGNSNIRVMKHDEARNMRACNYIRFCRLLVLAFPLDYQTMEFFKAAVAPFGRLITWYEGTNKSKTFLDCLVLTPDRIPHSFVVSQGTVLGGNGRSLTAPVYIIGGQFPDVFPANEDPVPVDGNPHPAHGHIAHANPDIDQNWMHDLAGAANVVLQDFGVNQNQMQEAMEDLAPPMDNAEGNNEGWPEWHNEADNGIGAEQEPTMLHHPVQPQDTISFDQSGSTANFLRTNGPDIHLSVDMFKRGYRGSISSTSTSSSDASSKLANEGMNCQFSVLWSAVASIYTRIQHNIPEQSSQKRSWSLAFENLQTQISEDEPEDLTKAIVRYRPVLHSVLLQIWAQKMEDYNATLPELNNAIVIEDIPAANNEPNNGLADMDMTADNLTRLEGPCTEASAKKCLLSAFDTIAMSNSKSCLPPRPPRSVVSLPTNVAEGGNIVPLTNEGMRRSPRLNTTDGYKHCQLEDMPRKRRRGAANKGVSGTVQQKPIELPVKHDKAKSPIPLDVLKGWGVDCGVPPSEVTDDLLLQGSSSTVLDDDTPAN